MGSYNINQFKNLDQAIMAMSGKGYSDLPKEKLVNISKKEQLKGMLIHKFKMKYGNRPQISQYIDNEVARFLKEQRLTQTNLENLDQKINKEAELREKR